MTTPPLTFGDYCAVYVPEDEKELFAIDDDCNELLCLNPDDKDYYVAEYLPDGEWELIKRLNDLTESQCHAMGFGPDPTSTTRWSSKDAFRSMYLAAGGDPQQNPVILRRI